MAHLDRLGRPLRSLRVSVTDRCNLRCTYCMPEREYVWLPRADVLRFEEIGALVDVLARRSASTRSASPAGEPLGARDLPVLVRILAGERRLADLA